MANTLTPQERTERLKAIYTRLKEIGYEESVHKDSSILFADSTKRDLATLKVRGESYYVRIIDEWKKLGVQNLPQLRKSVDQFIAKGERAGAKYRIEGDDGLVRDGWGKIVQGPDNIRAAIAGLGVTLRYDAFRGRSEILGLPDFGPALDDAALRRLWLAVEGEYGFQPTRALFDEVVLDACRVNQMHPVRDYLQDVEDYGWDGFPRLDTWLITYAGAADTPYTRAVGRLVLLAAVRRVRQPGSKFDEMLVLESPEQGVGKSSLLAALAVRPDWFTDSVPLSADDKVMIERTAGKWICEVGELQGMRKGEIEKIRAQQSRTHDRARMAYERLPDERARQFILIGTTNASKDSPYLGDIAGNRRYWPVEVDRCDVAGLVRDRDKLWAEAAIAERAGASIRLDESMWASAGIEQDARAIGNPFLDVLGPALGNRDGIIRAEHAWRILRIPVERRKPHTGEFGKAMKSLGWERKQVRLDKGGDPIACYRKGTSDRVMVVEESGRDIWVGYRDEAVPTTAEEYEEAY